MRVLWMSLMTVACAVPAQAQGTDSRAYAAGIAGLAWTGSASAPMVAGQAGVRIASHLFVFAEGGVIRDVLPAATRDELGLIGRLVALDAGSTDSPAGRLSAWYGAGGIRWMWARDRWAPFVEGGAGVAALRLHVDPIGMTDSASLESDLRADDPDTADASRLLLLAGGGVTVLANRRWSVDAAYRYSRINTTAGINVHTVYGAFRYHF
jgi:opacity protein-like surface antigen